MKSQKSLERLGQAALRIVSPRSKDREKTPSNPSSPRKLVPVTIDTVDTSACSATDVETVAANAEILPPAKENEQTTDTTIVVETQNNNNPELQLAEVKALAKGVPKSESEDILDDSESSSEPPPTKLEIVASISKPEIPPVGLPTAGSVEAITETSDGAISARSGSALSNPTTPRANSGKFRPRKALISCFSPTP